MPQRVLLILCKLNEVNYNKTYSSDEYLSINQVNKLE